MKTFESQPTTVQTLSAITCDCCKKTWTREDDEMDFTLEHQEFLSFNMTGGYGAVMGDMNQIQLDLCQYCQVLLLGDYIRVTDEGKTSTAKTWIKEYHERVTATYPDVQDLVRKDLIAKF